ncbi:hypothetical protein Tco_0555204, partial [Tanacetum coccineum]
MKVTDLTASVAVRERYVVDLDTQLTSVKFQNDNLVDWVHTFTLGSRHLPLDFKKKSQCMRVVK